MPGDLAPPKAGAKGVAFDRLHTAPKADQIPEGLKTPKRQHSSRFDVSEKRELEKLPGFHGMPPSRPDCHLPVAICSSGGLDR